MGHRPWFSSHEQRGGGLTGDCVVDGRSQFTQKLPAGEAVVARCSLRRQERPAHLSKILSLGGKEDLDGEMRGKREAERRHFRMRIVGGLSQQLWIYARLELVLENGCSRMSRLRFFQVRFSFLSPSPQGC